MKLKQLSAAVKLSHPDLSPVLASCLVGILVGNKLHCLPCDAKAVRCRIYEMLAHTKQHSA